MKLPWISFAVLMITLTACSTQEEPLPEAVCPDEGTCSFEFSPNSRLAVFEVNGKTQISGIETGENHVFRYTYQFNDNPNIADDEYMEEVLLEIPEQSGAFDYSDADLAALPVYFRRVCFCPSVEWASITGGRVVGEPVSGGGWDVSVEISFELLGVTETRTFRGVFE